MTVSVDIANPSAHFAGYSRKLSELLAAFDWAPVEDLAREMLDCWRSGRTIHFCGNGGSAGNANHVVNDFLYPVSKRFGSGIKVNSMSANPAVITCLGNDEGYENVFTYQLAVDAAPGDVLVVLSGSGNSPNIVKVLEEARRRRVKSYAVLGFSGGKAKELADVPIHFAIDDMQIAEDVQTIVFHMIMQWLHAQRDSVQPASPAAASVAGA